jgi:hypothetical protein
LERLKDIDVPQADSLQTVGNLVALISSGIEAKSDLESHLGIVSREIDYYLTAARILGFLDDSKKICELGRQYCDETSLAKKRMLMRQAIRDTAFGRALLAYISEKAIDGSTVKAFLRESTNLSESTASRRAKTIVKWFRDSARS